MLSRLLPKPSHFRLLTSLSLKSQPCPPSQNLPSSLLKLSRFLSTDRGSSNNGGDGNGGGDRSRSASGVWNLSRESDGRFDQFFDETEVKAVGGGDEWMTPSANAEVEEEHKPWNLVDEVKENLFDIGDGVETAGETGGEIAMSGVEEKVLSEEELRKLEMEEKELSVILEGKFDKKLLDSLASGVTFLSSSLLITVDCIELICLVAGPNRAFGDLMSASGITDAMLDSLMALKDFEGVEGLPPLSEIEDIRYEKNTRKSTRSEIERQKQEEIAKSRVRRVDEKGRAYGTGRRKCSIARVWIQPGDGKFVVNDKEFDVYFPMLEHRAALLRPFSETKTLGLWDVSSTVKGGGYSGELSCLLPKIIQSSI
ncbi:hypothetical protein JRO89_XS11G0199400 [Xanthoceras sorbifolium]|uniref:Ribosomal protein S9 n=1 Tax=Xanthoceras sorbifolium TaxID=99658 RepID=A0ABQ8HGE0_9ROSI|nr:hypothetical protein JRO89_XS11G0199400 [Xanthoceras sorbifolium]